MDYVDLDVAECYRLAAPSFLSPPCLRLEPLYTLVVLALALLPRQRSFRSLPAGRGRGWGSSVKANYPALTCSLRSAIFRTAPTRERLFIPPPYLRGGG